MTDAIGTTVVALAVLLAPSGGSMAAAGDGGGRRLSSPIGGPCTSNGTVIVSESAVSPSTTHSDPTIHRALGFLGQPVDPVRVVNREQAWEIYRRCGAGIPSTGLNAFRLRRGTIAATIYVNGDSAVFRNVARNPTPLAILKLAATLVHEQVHRSDDDLAAYRLQSDFVRSRLGALPRGEQEEAHRYLRSLEARASAHVMARLHRRKTQPLDFRAAGSALRNR